MLFHTQNKRSPYFFPKERQKYRPNMCSSQARRRGFGVARKNEKTIGEGGERHTKKPGSQGSKSRHHVSLIIITAFCDAKVCAYVPVRRLSCRNSSLKWFTTANSQSWRLAFDKGHEVLPFMTNEKRAFSCVSLIVGFRLFFLLVFFTSYSIRENHQPIPALVTSVFAAETRKRRGTCLFGRAIPLQFASKEHHFRFL